MPEVFQPNRDVKPELLGTETLADMSGLKKFNRRLLTFVAPFLVIILLVETVLWLTGESWPVEKVIRYQRSHPEAVFMRGLLDQAFYRYKFLQLKTVQPKILVLGSSRVMKLRKEMFGQGANSFYNAGGMIQDLEDLRVFVDSLAPETTPEIVLLGIDLWWFNEHASRRLDNAEDLRSGATYEAATDWQAHLKALRSFESKKVFRPAFRALLASNGNVGIQARNSGAGFRPDGSLKDDDVLRMHYRFALPQNASEWQFKDREDPPIPERIKNGWRQFASASGLSLESLSSLKDSLERLKARKVMVLGFLPPFSSECATLLATSPGQSNLWNEFRSAVPALFEKLNLPCVDATDTSALHLDDTYLVDGIHTQETFHIHLLLRFLEDPNVERLFPGLRPHLERMISSPRTNPWYPDYQAN